MYCIWLDDARQREQLALAHAAWAVAAARAGAKRHEIGDWTDPADLLADDDDQAGTGRARDPATRAAQIGAFLAGAGQAAETATTTPREEG